MYLDLAYKTQDITEEKDKVQSLGYPTLYKGKLEIPIGKSSGLQHSV